MTITVPKAGNNPGRAAQVFDKIHVPDTGAQIARLGQTMFQVGQTLQADREGREMQRLKVDLTRDFNDLRLQAMEIGDPDQLDAFWSAGTAGLRERYAPRVSERNREAFGLAFDGLANNYGYSVGKDALAARQSAAEADWLAYESEIVRGATVADAPTRAMLVESGTAAIDELVARGVISVEEGQRRKLALAKSADNAAAIQAIKTDPAAFLEDLDAGRYPGFDGEAEARYRVQAQTAIEQLAKAEATAASQAAKEREAQIGALLGQIGTAVEGGRPPAVDLSILDLEEVQAHPDYAKTMAAIELERETPLLAQLPPAELDALIAEERQRPVAFKYQTERLEVLTELRDRAGKAANTDPMGHAQSVGLPVPDLPPFDPGAPRPFVESLIARRATGEWLIENGYTDALSVMSEAEKADAKAAYGPQADPMLRTEWLTALAHGLGPEAGRVAATATGDPTMRHAADLLAQGVTPDVVRDIFAGQRRVADKTVVVPSRNEVVTAFNTATGGAMADLFDLAPAVIDAATFLYVEAGGDPAAITAKLPNKAANIWGTELDLFGASLQRALGGSVDVDGRWSVGGLQEFGDTLVLLPPGVHKRDVEAGIDALAADLSERWVRDPDGTGGVDGPPLSGTYTEPKLDRFAAISVTGAPPDFGENTRLDEAFDNYQFEELVDQAGRPTGEYVFYREANGARAYLPDANGQLYKFRMDALLREARR